MLALARAAFGRFARPPGEPDILVEAVVADGTVDGAPDTPPHRFHRERGGLYAAGDDRGSVVVADLAAGRAAAFVDRRSPPDVVRTVLLESTVWRMAAWRGRVALHAAAVVVRGRTFVLRGPGGAGKSTLAAKAARAGHTVVAEEVVWFDPTGPTPVLRGMPWSVHLEPDAAAAFVGQAAPSGQGGTPRAWSADDRSASARAAGASKRALDVERDLGGACAEVAPPGALVFLERAGAGADVAALDREDAHARFRDTLLPGETTQRAAGLSAACDDLLAHGAYVLRSASPAAALAALEALAGGQVVESRVDRPRRAGQP
ncbi:hypothetical protein DCC79_08490 [bacterium]|nr:MAG: hypothetical protein DCC79_08490 [bacterium]